MFSIALWSCFFTSVVINSESSVVQFPACSISASPESVFFGCRTETVSCSVTLSFSSGTHVAGQALEHRIGQSFNPNIPVGGQGAPLNYGTRALRSVACEAGWVLLWCTVLGCSGMLGWAELGSSVHLAEEHPWCTSLGPSACLGGVQNLRNPGARWSMPLECDAPRALCLSGGFRTSGLCG